MEFGDEKISRTICIYTCELSFAPLSRRGGGRWSVNGDGDMDGDGMSIR